MLITELKNKDTILSLAAGKVFILNCHGCKEIRFPEKEADALQAELAAAGKVTGSLTTDYICNPENLKLRLQKHAAAIEAADIVLMDDNPLQIVKAIRISKKCIGIVKQNIVFALAVKFACLGLSAIGIANMWFAIFADVGVMILAVLNAIRALRVHKL